ncbi:uncharacterized protein LOC135706770 [Ochlerotatus camptorhynchus]|uniref:uncharacterized protein LOC135706770 n=1 Tax=Ochlerotatus camptorhynchus TaxID=644619 RepID=UPI0031CE80AF
METKPCSMCLRPKAPLSNCGKNDREVEELLGHFEVPADSFRGSQFCPDCLKLLALTHQISVKVRKRKQPQEEQGKPPVVVPGRRPSNEAKQQSLAKRMCLAQAARGGLKGQKCDTSDASATGSDDKHESESESAAGNDVPVSHSDDEEYRNEGGKCSSSFRSRTRTL